jgi:hypothetical protein
VYLCVPYGCQNKQRLFPQRALTGWALLWRSNAFPARYEVNSYDKWTELLMKFTKQICSCNGSSRKITHSEAHGISVFLVLHILKPSVVDTLRIKRRVFDKQKYLEERERNLALTPVLSTLYYFPHTAVFSFHAPASCYPEWTNPSTRKLQFS